jgi:hypothetical protein
VNVLNKLKIGFLEKTDFSELLIKRLNLNKHSEFTNYLSIHQPFQQSINPINENLDRILTEWDVGYTTYYLLILPLMT